MNRRDNHYDRTSRHKLEECYSLGIVTTDEYNLIIKAMDIERAVVIIDNHPTKDGHYFKWSITIESEWK